MSGGLPRQPARKGDAHVLPLRVLEFLSTREGTGRDIAAALDADQKQVDNVVRLLRVDGRISVVGERDIVRTVTQKLKVFGRVPKATPAKVETLNRTEQVNK